MDILINVTLFTFLAGKLVKLFSDISNFVMFEEEIFTKIEDIV